MAFYLNDKKNVRADPWLLDRTEKSAGGKKIAR